MTTTTYIKNTVYILPYKNLLITLKFNETNTFWQKYPKQLSETIENLIGKSLSLSSSINILATTLSEVGLYSVQVLDSATGSGMEITTEQTATKPVKKSK